MGGAPIAAGNMGETPSGASDCATSSSVAGKPTPNRMSPAIVSKRASARSAAGLGQVWRMAPKPSENRANRETRHTRSAYVACALHDHMLVRHGKHGFHHQTLRRRNY